MPVFDVRCLDPQCGEVTEVFKAFRDAYPCPVCKHPHTKTLMPLMRDQHKAKDPFDLVGPGARIPDSRPIKSFANDKRKGGKDTT